MPLRTRLIIIIGLIIVAVAGVFFFLRYRQAQPTPAQNVPTVKGSDSTDKPTQTTSPTEIPAGATVKAVTTLEAEQNGVKQLAKVFVERYNSFSTDNNYQNIREVEELVTPFLWTKISAKLTTPNKPADTFTSVITEAVNASMSLWQTDSATITVNARKITETNRQETELYQNITVVMVKQNSTWLADSFTVK